MRTDPSFLVGLATSCQNQGKYSEAESLFRQALELLPTGSQKIAVVLAGLAASCQQQGKDIEAEELYRHVLTILPANDPKREIGLMGLAAACLQLGKYHEAEILYKELLNLLPSNDAGVTAVTAAIAAACQRQGKDAEAEELFRTALSRLTTDDPNTPKVMRDFAASCAEKVSKTEESSKLALTVPEQIRADIEEADRCISMECWNAFGAMARRVVHSICAERGASDGDLYSQINELSASKILRPEEARIAHQLRTLGRNGAHPEWEEVSEEMAGQGKALLYWLVQELYDDRPPHSPDWSATGKKRYTLPKR